MIISSIDDFSSMSMVRAKVDIYEGTTLATTCTCEDSLQRLKISREGDTAKFFGFGVCHKLSVELIDLFRNLPPISTANHIIISLGDGELFDTPYPKFYITEVNRDEKSNSITATAYDKLYKAAGHTFEELTINAPYTIKQLAEACSELLGVTLKLDNVSDTSFDTLYEEGGNFEPADTIRYILNAISEVTQTIYFINNQEELVFKRLDKDGDAVHTIDKDHYYELNTKTNRRLSNICSATELGDNIEATTGVTGTTQYIRDNPLLELRTDVAAILENAIANIGGLTISQFDCDWYGDYRLEIGDKIGLVTEDDTVVYSYLLSDIIEYAGSLNQVTKWEYTEQTSETPSNPTNLGDKLNQTFARVDKVNKEITLVAARADEVSEQIGQLQVTTDNIDATVKAVEKVATEKVDSLSNEIETLTNEVNLKLSSEEVTIAITNTLTSGVDKVVTATKKYTFDDTGLNVGSSDSSISTTITEDGMRIYRSSQEVLTADNTGVKAEDLHATTYLIIGENSRFEDWQNNYTACFWIGG